MSDVRTTVFGWLSVIFMIGYIPFILFTVTRPDAGATLTEFFSKDENWHNLSGVVLGGGVAVWLLSNCMFAKYRSSAFRGAKYQSFLRGTEIVTAKYLYDLTKQENSEQISVAGFHMPSHVESLHVLLNGATGTGKSVLLRDLVDSALYRGDRLVIVDPNGDMYSKFGNDNDIILNPYDKRGVGWSFFNEIRNPYDFQRLAFSIVPKGKTDDAEEWHGYSRLLLRETARKLWLLQKPSVKELLRWTTQAHPDDLKQFLEGTFAESLFVGSSEASKALSSARFILSDKLPEHVSMPKGNFSLRDWLSDETAGNLYITWREDMSAALRPLISAWVDVLCTSVLSLPEDKAKPLWLVVDELASLEKLSSLQDALTKGRKHGLRVVAGLQSTSQLDNIYGATEAQIIRSCFRSLVVLGGSKTDPKTNEDMSRSLGEHEVLRERKTESKSTTALDKRSSSESQSYDPVCERVVSAAEISGLPDLVAYVAFAGNYPIARVRLDPIDFEVMNPAFMERQEAA